jgi:hypothetical protein
VLSALQHAFCLHVLQSSDAFVVGHISSSSGSTGFPPASIGVVPHAAHAAPLPDARHALTAVCAVAPGPVAAGHAASHVASAFPVVSIGHDSTHDSHDAHDESLVHVCTSLAHASSTQVPQSLFANSLLEPASVVAGAALF